MDLYLIRHAKAAPRSPELEDALRPLTPEGKRAFAIAVEGMARLGLTFDRLYHSPWLRAVETAELLIPLVHGETVSTMHLADDPSSALLRELSGQRVALVGHEPWTSELVGWLIHGDRAAGDGFCIKKGGMVWLEGKPAPGQMVLRAFLPPKVLRALSRPGNDDDNTE
ncbi:MAG: histidine phosphatase family protein [Candidatus Zixiibacteriota bacterium]